ncbi:outer membrane beta-barrel protein [Myxococcaceae bacterium JPH2]|nr:outer membrane beta-barrel protein [Myxococcaceae bacterium JPH2]
MRLTRLLPLGLLALAAPALAASPSEGSTAASSTSGFTEEDLYPTQRFMFNVGGGVSFPLADSADHFQVGGGFQLGAGFKFLPRLGVEVEYVYTSYGLKNDVLNTTGLDGDHTMQYGALDAVVDVMHARPVGVYAIGGPGIYYRQVQLNRVDGVGLVPFCDPWLLVCSAEPVAVTQVVGSRSSTDFGLNGGVGVTLRIYGPLRLYVEGRYHYIFGPKFTAQDGSTKRANGEYIPIMFGLRY